MTDIDTTDAAAQAEIEDVEPGSGPDHPVVDPTEELRRMATSRGYTYAALGVLVVGVLFTVAVVIVQVIGSRDERRDRFDEAANDTSTALQSELAAYTAGLVDLRGFFAADPLANREGFEDYVEASALLDRLPGMRLVGFAPVVSTSDLDEFEDVIRDNSYVGFSVQPEPDGDEVLPVSYLAPLSGNEDVLGFDLGSSGRGRAEIEQAAGSGAVVAGGPVVVPGATPEDQRTISLYAPVYGAGAVPDGEADRLDEFSGVTLSLLDVGGVLDPLLGPEPEAEVEIYDLGPADSGTSLEPVEGNLVYNSSGGLEALGGDGLHRSIQTTVAGRTWELHLTPGPGFAATSLGVPWLILLAGLAITGLLAALLLSFSRTRREAATLADEMTAYLRQREQELSQANADIVRSNKELERYASIAAHDLQEPLRSLLGFASVLERRYGESLDEEVLDHVHRMAQAAERMRSLVVDLLAYAKAESAERKIEQVDLNEAVRVAIDDLSLLIQETGATVRVAELPTVPGNRRELIGLFSNLVSNALKYRSERPPEVLIVGHEKDRVWTIGVKDNGIGIAPAYHERVFELFRRLEKRPSDAGTGLGLAICVRTVQAHGGRIWVDSAEGEGSTFWFTLPAGDRAPADGGLAR